MKKAIILGATSGIGRELAKIFAQKGWKVAVTGRRAELLDELKKENPEAFITGSFDINDTGITEMNLNDLAGELGGLDLLFVSSGTGQVNGRLKYEIEKRAIDTNITGFTFIALWAWKYFSKQGHGHFASITSVSGLRGSRHGASYCATKAYQIRYLEALSQKAAKSKKPIFITDIRPGFVDTAMSKSDGIFWKVPVDKAARQIYKALQAKKHVAYISKRWVLVALFLKIIPRYFYNKM